MKDKIVFYMQLAWFVGLVIIGLLSYFGPDIIREQTGEPAETRKRRHGFSSPSRQGVDRVDHDVGTAKEY